MTEYMRRIYKLEQTFEGVKDPKEMGTTGLIGWVCVSSGAKLYIRFRVARKIIRERGLDVDGFAASCISSAPCTQRKERLQRYSGKQK